MKRMYMSLDGKTLKRVPKNCKGKVVVPEGVESIAKRAFAGDMDITDITLPSTLKTLGEEAFEGCTSLIKIKIPKGVDSIPKRAFANCESLESICLPKNLKEVGKGAFEHCYLLSSIVIPEGVKSIQQRAFAYSGLTTIYMPSSLKEIGKDAFRSSEVANVIIPDSVEVIASGAFADCSELAEVKLPSSLRSLGVRAFDSCRKLSSIDIPKGVTTIPEECFSGCRNLTSAIFHDGLKYIKANAFSYCRLTFIKINSTVEVIGEEAFCNNEAVGLNIGESVRSIGKNAFWFNDLKTITIDEDNKYYTDAGCKVIMEKGTGKVIRGTSHSTIPNNATCIALGAFQNIPKVLVIPASVKVIETAAFFNCPAESIIVLQDGVTTLKWGAFQQQNGNSITVYIPSTTNYIEGQYSSVEFHLDAANKNYRYDTEGHNIISTEGTLVWGHLLQGIPTEGVSRIEAVNSGACQYSVLKVPENITYISDNICRLLYTYSGFKHLILYKGTRFGMYNIEKTNCEITVIVPQDKSGVGISKNIEYVIPKGTTKDEINAFLGNDSIIA